MRIKWRNVRKIASTVPGPVMSDSLQAHGLQPARLLGPRNSPGKNTGVGCHALLQGIFPTQGSPRSPTLQADSLPAEPQGKPKNTEVDSLSPLQQIFATQESNWDLLHCRRILYQPSYQSSPSKAFFSKLIINRLWSQTCLPFKMI